MHSSQFGITFTDSRGPVNSDGPIHCIRSLNRMVRYSVMPLPVALGLLPPSYDSYISAVSATSSVLGTTISADALMTTITDEYDLRLLNSKSGKKEDNA